MNSYIDAVSRLPADKNKYKAQPSAVGPLINSIRDLTARKLIDKGHAMGTLTSKHKNYDKDR